MNIIFLLGNGFDVNLDLKTKYTDFYKHYKNIEPKNESIRKLKNKIEDEETWADLELALGMYTSEIKTKNEFIEIFEDIGDNLAEYLRHLETIVDSFEIDETKFYEHLSYPERLLPAAQKNQVEQIRVKWDGHHWQTYVITFNYTKTFEKLIGENNISIEMGSRGNPKIYYQGINHVHGYIDDRMVMGVNDISQIENKLFHNDPEILNAFVKSQCNKAMQHLIDNKCEQRIQSANLICIYGSSLGITDKLWWETIGTRLKHECYLIIFWYEPVEIIPRRDYKRDLIREKVKRDFLEKTKLSEKEKELAYSKIFVGINRNLFKIKKVRTSYFYSY